MPPKTTNCILLTGGTGFLGSHIAVNLLRKGYQVYFLTKNNNCLSAEERIKKILGWHGLDSNIRANSMVVQGDILSPGLDLEKNFRTKIQNSINQVVHCASNTSFSYRHRDKVRAINIDGLKNVLDFASESRCSNFHHLSTAYVGSRQNIFCPETLVNRTDFVNVYEESKCQAEWLAWDRCRTEGIRLTIYRPSIVYGHSQTGRSFRFNGLYYPIRIIQFLKNIYKRDIQDYGGKKAAQVGVKIDSHGSTYLPLRIDVTDKGGVNIIPIDYFLDTFSAIMEENLKGIFHIVSPGKKRIEEIVEYIKEYFKLRGIKVSPNHNDNRESRNALEALFDLYLEAYKPYIRDNRIFIQERAQSIQKSRGIICPEFDFEIFSRCMNYALKVDWKMNLKY